MVKKKQSKHINVLTVTRTNERARFVKLYLFICREYSNQQREQQEIAAQNLKEREKRCKGMDRYVHVIQNNHYMRKNKTTKGDHLATVRQYGLVFQLYEHYNHNVVLWEFSLYSVI